MMPGALLDDLQTSRFGMLGTPSCRPVDEILPDPDYLAGQQAGVLPSTASHPGDFHFFGKIGPPRNMQAPHFRTKPAMPGR